MAHAMTFYAQLLTPRAFGSTPPRPRLAGASIAARQRSCDLALGLRRAGWQAQAGPVLPRLQPGPLQTGLSFLAALLLFCEPAQAGDILLGPARVIDGDTMEVAGTRIRMYGVDAPETKQSCTKGGIEYACGLEAKQALAAKVGTSGVACEVKNKDLYGRSVAQCFAAEGKGGDLGAYMVENGYAVAYRQYSKEYIPLEEKAQAAKRGIWAGAFQEPAQWRKEHPRTGAPAASASSGAVAPVLAAVPVPAASAGGGKSTPPNPACPIKGNINAKGEKIFHLPGGRSYDATDIDTAQGERWFCTEKEAAAAGWRAAKN